MSQDFELQPAALLPPLSRRNFLKGMLGIVGAVAATSTPLSAYADSAFAAETQTENIQAGDSVEYTPANPTLMMDSPSIVADQFTATDTDTSDRPSEGPTYKKPENTRYRDTAIKTAEVYGANLVIFGTAKRLGIPTGNAYWSLHTTKTEYQTQLRQRSPVREVGRALWSVAGAPLSEEALFRALPSLLVDKRMGKGTHWDAGAATSAAFAAIHFHNHYTKEKVIPIEAFNVGMFNWWLERNRGYKHAVLAHALCNILPNVERLGRYAVARRS